MKTNRFKWMLVFLFIEGAFGSTLAQITGPTTSCLNVNTDYVFNNGNIYTGTTWLITNGTIMSSYSSGPNYYVTVQWTVVGTGTLSFKWKGILGSINVNVVDPAVPSTTFTYSGNCGGHIAGESTTITRTSNPPSGITWYWQTSAQGTSTSLGSGPSIDVSPGQAYYLRAFGSCWSYTSQATAIIPQAPTVLNSGTGCLNSPVTISASYPGNPPQRWYDACSGGNLVGTGPSYTTPPLTATTNYYVAVYDTYTGAESPRKTIQAIVNSPVPPSTSFTYAGNCSEGGNGQTTTITRTSNPVPGTTWYWQSSSNGMSTALGGGTNINVAEGTTYYLQALTNGCWSSTSLATATIPMSPTTLNDATGCINTSVTISASYPGNPPQRWYDLCSGGSMVGTGPSYTISPLTYNVSYYVSVYDPNTGAESPRKKVNATIFEPPTPSTGFSYSSHCSTDASGLTTTITRIANPPGGTSWYWQTSSGGTSTSLGGPSFDASAGTTYYLRAQSNGCWSSSALATAPIPQAPNTINNGSGCINSTVTISASYPGNPPQRWYDACSGGNLVGTGISYTTPPLAASTSYYVTVYDNVTGAESPRKKVDATILNPGPPTTLEETNQTETSFIANWTLVSGNVSYLLDVLDDQGATLPNYNNVSVSGTTQSVIELLPGHRYSYRVQTVTSNPVCISSESSSIEGWTLPSAPTISIILTKSSSFIMQWNPVTGANGYRLDVSRSSTFEAGQYVNTYENFNVSGTSTEVSGLDDHVTYYCRLRAENSSGSGANSATVSTNFDLNYLRTTTPLIAFTSDDALLISGNVNEKMVSTSFVDGLGRPIQTVSMRQTPNQLDLVQPIGYDEFGREGVKYLPFSGGNDGWNKFDFRAMGSSNYATSSNPQYQFYQGTSKVAVDVAPYAVTVFDGSPINRVLKQGSPGQLNQPDVNNSYGSEDHTVKTFYGTNGSTEVRKWNYVPSGTYPLGLVEAGTVANPTYYGNGQLTLTKSKDENANEVIEYKDKHGRLVLKRVQAVINPDSIINDTDFASTYYVYDDLGNLSCVIPPSASKLIATGYLDTLDASKDTFLSRWAFRYTYDNRRRMTQKQVPGADPVYMVYDDRDRLVMTQDGNQRHGKQWTYTKYDALNRPIMTGIYTHGTVIDQAGMKNLISTANESYNGVASTHGYTNTVFPTANTNPLTVTYYDDYSFRSMWSGTWTYVNESLSEPGLGGVTYYQPASEFTRVVGQVTGTKTKVLDGGATGNYTWLKAVNYYDDRYRVVQSISDNYKGGTDRITNVIDFTGKVLKTRSTHSEQDITWKDLVGTTVVGNKIERTLTGSSWAAGGVSTAQLPAGQNGWIEFIVSDISGNKMIGLADTNPNANYTSIDYCFYLNGSSLKVYENGAQKTLNPAVTLVVGDKLRIERVGTTIYYKRNGASVYQSLTSSSTLLMTDVSIYAANLSIPPVVASFASSTDSVRRRFEYDHAGRLVKVWHKLNAQQEILLLLNEYNELGQLVDKKLHSTDTGSTWKQSIDYRYNIRGWIENINNSKLEVNAATNDDTDDLFGMELKYNSVDTDISNTAMFNGNISGVKWSNYPGTGSTKEKGYTYSYDPMNRILGSVYKEKTTSWSTPANNVFAETGFSYDLNGNILTLNRNDGRTTGPMMDNLVYDYTNSGNQLIKVTDNGDDYKGFGDGINGGNDYAYDFNGNMIIDQNKGITDTIRYNHLNLPEVITRGANTVRYIYDASGRKLWQGVYFAAGFKQTDYAGEYIYEGDALQFINHEEGRIVVATNTLTYTNPGENATDFTAVNATLTTVTQNGTEKYVKVTSGGTTARTGVFPIGGTFPVVAGEKYRIRVKGYRAGSNAAYIQAKASGTDIIWPGATIASSAASESWTEQTVTIPVGATTLQVGVNWNTVTNGEIMYLNEVEVTNLATNVTPEYQYYLKDHLGNVRTTFTTVTSVDQNTATLEDANLNVEQSQFVRIATAKRVYATLFDKTNGASPGYSQRLNGSTNEKYGVAKSISVMPGDVIQAQVYGKYVDQNTSNWTGALTTLMNQIATNTTGVVFDGTSYGSSTTSFPYQGLLSTAGSTGGPKAYLNWLIFDRDYNFITGGYQRMSSAPMEQGQDVAHELLSSGNITITQPGYVYIYLSNEETSPVEVYFDDFKVTFTKSLVVQVEDYYPFGLTFNSYSRESSTENRYLYNQGTGAKTFKTERVYDLALNVDQSRDRTYDYITGRWWQVDPKGEQGGQESWSTYHYSFNNPVRYNDPDGDCIPCVVSGLIAEYSALAASLKSSDSEIVRLSSGTSTLVPQNITEHQPSELPLENSIAAVNDGAKLANNVKSNTGKIVNQVSKDGLGLTKAIATGLEYTPAAPIALGVNIVAEALDQKRMSTFENKSGAEAAKDFAVNATINLTTAGLGTAAKGTMKASAGADKVKFDRIIDVHTTTFNALASWMAGQIKEANKKNSDDKKK